MIEVLGLDHVLFSSYFSLRLLFYDFNSKINIYFVNKIIENSKNNKIVKINIILNKLNI